MDKSEYDKNRYSLNKDRWVEGQISRKYRIWAYAVLYRHKKEYEISISLDDLEQLAKNSPTCYYCGTTLIYYGNKTICRTSPTLDRIDNSNILTSKNVRIICHRCNSGKSSDTEEEYITRCRHIVDRRDKGVI